MKYFFCTYKIMHKNNNHGWGRCVIKGETTNIVSATQTLETQNNASIFIVLWEEITEEQYNEHESNNNEE